MLSDLTKEQIESEVRRLAPFAHKVDLPYELSTYIPEFPHHGYYTRVDTLVKHAFPTLIEACGGSLKGKRVLDVACNCGGFSFEAAKLGSEYVLGVDVVDRYIEQANFIKRALKLKQVEFRRMDIEKLAISEVGRFDIIFCFGILYHLENFVSVMRNLSSMTKDIMLVDTGIKRTRFTREPYWKMNMPPPYRPESKNNARPIPARGLWKRDKEIVQFRPNEAAVIQLLQFLGFATVKKIEPRARGLRKRYYLGTFATFLAIRNQ